MPNIEQQKSRKEQIKKRIETLEWELIEETLKEQNKQDSLKKLELYKRANTKPFFLWKLNFAEIFEEKNGFDVVIANPPYVRQEMLGANFKGLMKQKYPEVANGTADLYVYFFALAFKILKIKGTGTYITPNKYLKTKYGFELRKTLRQYQTDKIIDFFELPIFEAANDTAITIFRNENDILKTKYYPIRSLNNLDLDALTQGNYLIAQKNETEWIFIDEIPKQILEKFCHNTVSLKDFVNDKIFSGIKTAFNEAFILSTDVAKKLLRTESKAIIKRYVQSTDIKRWGILNKDNYFLATGYDIDISKKYPNAYKFIKQFEKPLKKRLDKGRNWWNLRPCKYYEEIEKPKIIYMHTAKKHDFYLDFEGYYINNSCYMIISDNLFLLCFLNSKLFAWYKRLKFVAYGDADKGGRCKLDYNKMVTVPVRMISEAQKQLFISLINQIFAITKTKNYFQNLVMQSKVKEYEHQIDKMIYKLYELTPEEIEIVEKV